MNTKLMFSKKSDNWATPKTLFNELNKEFNFNFDPCPLNSEDLTSLFKDWKGSIFINPPYSNIANFMDKAILEIKKGNAHTIVFLVPARTDTKWFHNYVLKFNGEIRFIKGRLRFNNSKNPAPFPSLIIIFRKEVNTMHRTNEYETDEDPDREEYESSESNPEQE